MCYKDEKQRNGNNKLEEKIKDMPQFIKDYFVFLTSSSSKLSYWSCIRQLLEWLIEQDIVKHNLENITIEDLNSVSDIHIIKHLDGLKLGLYGKKNTPETINTKKNMFSSFWGYLLDKGYTERNIVEKVPTKMIKTAKKDVKVPTEEDIEALIANLYNIKNEHIAIRNVTIVKLLIGSGLRIEELVGLDVNDLHFENSNRRYVTIMGKGEYNSKDEVVINESAYIAIYEYLEDYLKIPKFSNINYIIKESKNPLFRSTHRNRLSQQMIQDFIYEYSNKTITPHMLRHYVGTMLYKNTKDILFVQKQLRHKNVNTSINYYIKDDKKGLVDAMNSF